MESIYLSYSNNIPNLEFGSLRIGKWYPEDFHFGDFMYILTFAKPQLNQGEAELALFPLVSSVGMSST